MKVQGEHFAPSVPYIDLDVDDTPRRDTPQRSGAGGTHWASKAAIDLLGTKKGQNLAEGGMGETGSEMLGDGDDDGKVEYDRTMQKARRIAEEGVERDRQEMEEALLERARLREAAKKVSSSEGGDRMDGQDDVMEFKRGKKSLEGRGGKRRGSQDDEVEARLKKRSERRGRQFEEPQSVIYMADENDDEDGNDVHSAKAKARALSIQVGGCL